MKISRKSIIITLSIITLMTCSFKLFGYYKSEIMHGLQDFSIHMRKIPFSPVLMCCLASIAGIPPMLGFTPTITVIGFIYGFPKGCIPATCAAIISASISFGLIRTFRLSNRIKLSVKRQEMYQAIQDAITQGGFKMILLIRICPLPWQLTNLLFPLIPTVTWKNYIISTILACVRFNMDVWVGSQLATISDPDLPPETHRATLIYMSIGLGILISSGVWVYRLTMQKIKEQQEKLLENEEYQRLLHTEDNVTEDNRSNSTSVGKALPV